MVKKKRSFYWSILWSSVFPIITLNFQQQKNPRISILSTRKVIYRERIPCKKNALNFCRPLYHFQCFCTVSTTVEWHVTGATVSLPTLNSAHLIVASYFDILVCIISCSNLYHSINKNQKYDKIIMIIILTKYFP